MRAVKPILEREGYTIKLISFSALLESNVATVEGSIDLTVAQHNAYLKVFNQQRNADLTAVVHVPSVPAAIFSDKYSALSEVKKGAQVAIPQDLSNAARAYNLLAKALLSETIIPDLEILVVVNKGMEESAWALAIKRIYQSDEFNAYMKAHNQNNYWVMPSVK